MNEGKPLKLKTCGGMAWWPKIVTIMMMMMIIVNAFPELPRCVVASSPRLATQL